MWNYNGTSIVYILGYGELEYDFFTINTQEDFSGLIDYYRALFGRFDNIFEKHETVEDNKKLSLNVKLVMKGHNANLCIAFLEDDFLGGHIRTRKMVVNREVSEGKYNTSFFNFFYFPAAGNASTYLKRGRAYQGMGYDFAAVMCYTYAIRFDPNKASTYMLRGDAYAKIGDYDSAIKDYTQAIKLEPNDAKIYALYGLRGISYAWNGNCAEALDDLSQAIKINPNVAILYIYRGLIYEVTDDFYSAKADYIKAIELDTDDETVQKRLEALDSKIDL